MFLLDSSGIYSVSLFIFMQRFINRIPLANKLSFQDQLFVTLVKLWLGMLFEYLADQCGIPISTLHDMFWRWIHILSAQLNFLIHWPETLSKTLPSGICNKFPRLSCIIDCIYWETQKVWCMSQMLFQL